MADARQSRRKRKMPHHGSGAIQSFKFADDQWKVFENKLGMELSPNQREQLNVSAIDFRLDWVTEVTWPGIDPMLRRLGEVERAAHLLLNVAFLPDEYGLVSILASAGTTKRDTNRLLRLHRHLADLRIKIHKYRFYLAALASEAKERSTVVVRASQAVATGPKGWRPKYRLLFKLKQILYPDEDSLPIGSKLRAPEVDGPRGGSSFHTSRFAAFLTDYLSKIPENKFKPALQQSGQLIKKFNGEYRRRQAQGIKEFRF